MRNLAKVKRKKSKGLTLIELRVVVAISGILAAIAIPQFAAYRQRGYRSQLVADVRNGATGEEAYFVDHQSYGSSCPNMTPWPPMSIRNSSSRAPCWSVTSPRCRRARR